MFRDVERAPDVPFRTIFAACAVRSARRAPSCQIADVRYDNCHENLNGINCKSFCYFLRPPSTHLANAISHSVLRRRKFLQKHQRQSRTAALAEALRRLRC
eukprot:199971-Prymnesium_polylepis.1